jgi:hypothetical protein
MFLLEERQLRPVKDAETWINGLVAAAFPIGWCIPPLVSLNK